MSEKVSVSVIIPVYNRAEAVGEAVKSVLDQTYRDWELIIADDGSSDGTLESLFNLKRDKRINIISLEHNGHPGFVRNRAAEFARGKWIAFLDSDDLWRREKLEKQMAYLRENQNCLFLHSGEEWVRSGNVVSQLHRKHKREGSLFEVSLGKCEIGPSTVIIDRELFNSLGGFREDLEICEDYEFWLRVTCRHFVGYIDEELVVKRAGAGDQLSFKYGFIENFKIEALKSLVDNDFFPPDKKVVARSELAKKCRIYGKGCRKRGREKEADLYDSLYFSYNSDDGFIES